MRRNLRMNKQALECMCERVALKTLDQTVHPFGEGFSKYYMNE